MTGITENVAAGIILACVLGSVGWAWRQRDRIAPGSRPLVAILAALVALSAWQAYDFFGRGDRLSPLRTQVPTIIVNTTGLPDNAVLGVDSPDGCPDGWEIFGEGRTLVGAGGKLPFRAEGGQAEQILSLEQLPYHDHELALPGAAGNGAFHDRDPAWGYDDWHGASTAASTSAMGDGKIRLTKSHEAAPIDTMPPFVVVYLCKQR